MEVVIAVLSACVSFFPASSPRSSQEKDPCLLVTKSSPPSGGAQKKIPVVDAALSTPALQLLKEPANPTALISTTPGAP